MSHLVPCPECNRHVRVSEAVCPFCALPLDLAHVPEPQLPRTRLSRAATLAFGTTLVSASALAACSSDGGVVPVYGAAAGTFPTATAGAAGTGGVAGTAGGTVGPVYGAPAAGAPATGGGGEAGTAGEAGDENSGGKGGGAVPLYGAAP